MRRRDFITGLGGAVVWPLAAQAQLGERVGRVGVLMPYNENDLVADLVRKLLLAAFIQGLSEIGWAEGRNLRIDYRWAAGSDRVRVYAKELVNLQPDLIFVESTLATAALQAETRTIPIVFVLVSDPVGSGLVAGLARPGGNITGFTHLEGTMAGKWLELLTDISPGVQHIAILFNPDIAPYVKSYYLPSFEAAARSFKVEAVPTPVHGDVEIEAVISSLGRGAGGGLVLIPDPFIYSRASSIFMLAARHNIPTIASVADLTKQGALLSYGADNRDLYRRAASYADRILRGANPADLPVQLPTKFQLIVNLSTAKTLGLTVPPSILLRADEVIE